MMEPADKTAQLAVADGAGSWASQHSPVVARVSRRRVAGFVLAGLLAYCAGLIALIPASAVLPRSDVWQVGGTIWNGEAVIGGTTQLTWRWSALASLSHLALTATWHMTGGATDLTGTASPWFGRLRLDDVSGVADGGLLGLAAPNLPVSCRFLAQVELARLIVGGSDSQAAGRVRTSPVHCTAKVSGAVAVAVPGGAVDLPALHGVIGPHGGTVGGASSGALFTMPARQHLVEVRFGRNGALSVWPTAALTARVPGLGGMRLDTVAGW